MLEVLPKALGLICIIVLGYTLKRVVFFKPRNYVLISKIALNITLPATVITSFFDFPLNSALIWIIPVGLAGNLVMTGIGLLACVCPLFFCSVPVGGTAGARDPRVRADCGDDSRIHGKIRGKCRVVGDDKLLFNRHQYSDHHLACECDAHNGVKDGVFLSI